MADIIKIKRSATTATPVSLETGELAYSENSGNLFIGRIADGVPVKIAGKTDVDKLAGIEAGATADQTGAEIKALYEAEANAYTDTKDSKLSGIEALADVTDATNVEASGAVMESDTSTINMAFVVDEDTMVSDSATLIPTQQSVKAYVDSSVASEMTYRGSYDASTNTPDLDVAPSGIAIGDMFTVTVDGNFFSTAVKAGDILIAEQNSPTLVSHWTIVESTNLDAPSIEAIVSHNNLLDYDVNQHFTQSQISITKSQVSDFVETDYATGAEGDLATTALQNITGESIKDLSDVFTTMTPSQGQALIYDNVNGWQAETIATGGLGNIVEDLTPQLGGDLDLNGKNIIDTNTNDILTFSPVTNAINNFEVQNSDTGNLVQLNTVGTDADVNIGIYPKNTTGGGTGGHVYINGNLGLHGTGHIQDSSGYKMLAFNSVGVGANYYTIYNSGTGFGPKLNAEGSDTNIDLEINPKGTGNVVVNGSSLKTNNAQLLIKNNVHIQKAQGNTELRIKSGTSSPSTDKAQINFDRSNGTDSMRIRYDESTGMASWRFRADSVYIYNDTLDQDIQVETKGTGRIKFQNITTGSGYRFPTSDGTSNQILSTNGSGDLAWVDQTATGVTTFTGLTDTPANFTGSGGYIVKVNAGATALEYQNGLDGGVF